MFEWTPITPDDLDRIKMEVWILERVQAYQAQMRDLVLAHIGRNVILEELDLSRGIRTIPMASLINAIERNLQNLVGTDVTADMAATMTWFGELRDRRRLDYTDVNRWFEILQQLYQFILTLQKRYLTTGTFHSGVNPDFQLLGVG